LKDHLFLYPKGGLLIQVWLYYYVIAYFINVLFLLPIVRARIYVMMSVEAFRTDVIVFISDVIMCFTSDWPIRTDLIYLWSKVSPVIQTLSRNYKHNWTQIVHWMIFYKVGIFYMDQKLQNVHYCSSNCLRNVFYAFDIHKTWQSKNYRIDFHMYICIFRKFLVVKMGVKSWLQWNCLWFSMYFWVSIRLRTV
jgi:hypothetical protein